MKIISFNVNGLRSAISKGFMTWLAESSPDVICLQEIKMDNPETLQGEFEKLGYQCYWMPARKKGYSGVAILSKISPQDCKLGCNCELYDCEGRVMQLQLGDITLINTYMPSGSSGPERQAFKMQWLAFFHEYISALKNQHQHLVLCGDYNICHQAIDIHNPVSNANASGFLPEERAWVTNFLQLGLVDTFRYLHPEIRHQYTWWSYRANCRNKNLGWRIDYHLISESLREKLKNAHILSEVRFSDHCPILIELSD